MYLKRFRIKNVKCFEDLELDFGEPGSIRLWTALLGRNGLGKSTLLQAMAAALAGPDALRELLPVAEGWARQETDFGVLEAELLWTRGDVRLLGVSNVNGQLQPSNFPQSETQSLKLRFAVTGTNASVLPNDLEEGFAAPMIVPWPQPSDRRDFKRLRRLAYPIGGRGWFASGYGPFRRLSGGTQENEAVMVQGRRSAHFLTLFREGAAVTNAADWLINLHNTGREGHELNARALEIVRAAIEDHFFPEPVELYVSASEALLTMAGRGPLAFGQLSDGYRSMLAMGIDLLRWMIRAFPDEERPTECPGVVLIDELDAHLHPTWQREIGYWLREKFPRIQFIIATHSPFLAQVAQDGGNIVLTEANGTVTAAPEPESVHTWRADQILTELFELPSTYSPDVNSRLRDFQRLYLKKHTTGLTVEEQTDFQYLCEWQETIPPPLEDPAQRRVAEALDEAVTRLDDEIRTLR